VWLTCRRDWQDAKILIARKLAKHASRTATGDGQVQPVLGVA
jgi:hypothetical protein